MNDKTSFIGQNTGDCISAQDRVVAAYVFAGMLPPFVYPLMIRAKCTAVGEG